MMSLAEKFEAVFLQHQNQVKVRNLNLRPELTTSSTKGIIILNPAARKLMEVGTRDRVLVFDMRKEATSNQDRFFLTKGFVYQNKPQGNKINLNGGFMDSSFYNLLMSNDFTIDQCSNDDLIRRGLFVRRNTASRNEVLKPVKRVTAEIVRYTEQQPDGLVVDRFRISPEMPAQPVFMVTNIEFINNPILEE
jgi:hypothetical protein